MLYLDTNHIISILNNRKYRNVFVNLSGRTDIIIPTFLVLKRIGVNTSKNVEYNEELALEAAYLLHSSYKWNEKHPKLYYIINPFNNRNPIAYMRKQSLQDYIKLTGNGMVNNYVGGGRQWRDILATEDRTPICLQNKYIDEIKRFCGINYSNRIDITRLAAWCFRDKEYENDSPVALTKKVIEDFIGFFNITDTELRELFNVTHECIKFSKFPLDYDKVRKSCFELSKSEGNEELNLTEYEDIKYERRNYFMVKNPNLKEIKEILKAKKQIILYGPPGVSKTHIAFEIGDLALKNDYEMNKIQFHQNYGYEHFVGGYFPVMKNIESEKELSETQDKKLDIEYQDGILLDIIKKSEEKPQVLIIDEINRGNISKIFGETIVLLDRNFEVQLRLDPFRRKIKLPDNLLIIGTMNSTDRSIALVDFAIRRRFFFIRLNPDKEEIRKYYENKGEDTKVSKNGKEFDLIELFETLNNRIRNNQSLGIDYMIGHTYFFLEKKELKSFQWQFNFSILPLLEEYSYADPSILIDIIGEQLPLRYQEEQTFINAIIDYLSSK